MMAHYRQGSRMSQAYNEDYCEEDDLDDEDGDGYECLSDYDDDLEYTEGHERREAYGRSQHGQQNANDAPGSSRGSDLRRHRSISEGCPRVIEHADDNRRDHHNHLERKRRASIKGSYSDLRDAIPGLRGSKASRAVTLQRAAEYIEELTRRNCEHTQCVETLTRQNDALERQIQDLSSENQRIEEDEYVTANGLGRGLAGAGSSTVFNQSTTFVSSTSGSVMGNGGNLNIRFIPPTAAVAASAVANGPNLALSATNSGSSATSPSGGSSSTGYPFVRVISQESANSSPDAANPPPASGLAQLSFAAMQAQQQQHQNATPLSSITAAACSPSTHSATAAASVLATFVSTPGSVTARPVVTVAQSRNKTAPIASSTNSMNDSQRGAQRTIQSSVPTTTVTLTASNLKKIKCTSSPIVVVAQASGSTTNNRKGTPIISHVNLVAPNTTPENSVPAVKEETVTTTDASFPLETAVLKARSTCRNTALPVAKSLNNPEASHIPSTPRRVVIVSTQEPPTSSKV